MDESKHEIHSQVDAITAGTASVVNLTAGQLLIDLLQSTTYEILHVKVFVTELGYTYWYIHIYI